MSGKVNILDGKYMQPPFRKKNRKMQPCIGKDFLIIASDISMIAGWCVVKYFFKKKFETILHLYRFII